jgi:hypothetical protein
MAGRGRHRRSRHERVDLGDPVDVEHVAERGGHLGVVHARVGVQGQLEPDDLGRGCSTSGTFTIARRPTRPSVSSTPQPDDRWRCRRCRRAAAASAVKSRTLMRTVSPRRVRRRSTSA